MRAKSALVPAVAGLALILSACSSGSGGEDMRPIGHGLEFLGMAGVLGTLILVFGKVISESDLLKRPYVAHLLSGLLVLLAAVVAIAAAPKLIIPILAVLAAVAAWVALERWKK